MKIFPVFKCHKKYHIRSLTKKSEKKFPSKLILTKNIRKSKLKKNEKFSNFLKVKKMSYKKSD
jgi:uncharacterized CHY-type Zn-finger protein